MKRTLGVYVVVASVFFSGFGINAQDDSLAGSFLSGKWKRQKFIILFSKRDRNDEQIDIEIVPYKYIYVESK